jgi:hypothetical protein
MKAPEPYPEFLYVSPEQYDALVKAGHDMRYYRKVPVAEIPAEKNRKAVT